MKTKIIIIALLFSPLYFFGWGAEGHRIVADVAQKNLDKGVEQKVQSYLGETSFEKASTWMDEIRSNHDYDYMKPWHYVNIEKDATYVKAKDGDIVSELEQVIGELRKYKELKPEEVAQSLKILFHLCGDITQPLHTGYGSDKGGNTFQVTFQGGGTNLHHIWDSDIIKSGNITAESAILRVSKVKDEAIVKKIDPVAWMLDSRSFLPGIYNLQDNKLTQEYINSKKDVVENQIAKGGLMLALVLNDVFKN